MHDQWKQCPKIGLKYQTFDVLRWDEMEVKKSESVSIMYFMIVCGICQLWSAEFLTSGNQRQLLQTANLEESHAVYSSLWWTASLDSSLSIIGEFAFKKNIYIGNSLCFENWQMIKDSLVALIRQYVSISFQTGPQWAPCQGNRQIHII